MSINQRRARSLASSSVQRSRSRKHTSGSAVGTGTGNAASSSRSSNRQTKATNHGFYFGEAQAAERDVEKIEREQARDRKKREQRLEELERGNAPMSSWNDSSNIPAASTSAAAIAGLLAGRQAEQEIGFDDISSNSTINLSNSSRKKQSAELRRLLTQRRSLKLLLEDASSSPIVKTAPMNFLKALQVEQRYPVHRATAPICSICGYWGDIRCRRCHERICGLKCGTTHDETRCERPV